MHPRDWIVPMVELWASQKRRLVYGRNDGHVEGWSVSTVVARIMEEGAGASHASGRVYQAHPDVYTGDALLIQRAVQLMPELPRSVLAAHWLIKGSNVHEKAAALGMQRSAYYEALDNAYHYLAGRVDEMRDAKPDAA